MEVNDLHIWCDSANRHVTVGADGILAASPNDSGDVSAVTVLVVRTPTERIVVVDDSIMSLGVLQVVHPVDTTVNDGDGDSGSVIAKTPCVVGQHAHGCIIHLPCDGPIWRDISNVRIVSQ